MAVLQAPPLLRLRALFQSRRVVGVRLLRSYTFVQVMWGAVCGELSQGLHQMRVQLRSYRHVEVRQLRSYRLVQAMCGAVCGELWQGR